MLFNVIVFFAFFIRIASWNASNEWIKLSELIWIVKIVIIIIWTRQNWMNKNIWRILHNNQSLQLTSKISLSNLIHLYIPFLIFYYNFFQKIENKKLQITHLWSTMHQKISRNQNQRKKTTSSGEQKRKIYISPFQLYNRSAILSTFSYFYTQFQKEPIKE